MPPCFSSSKTPFTSSLHIYPVLIASLTPAPHRHLGFCRAAYLPTSRGFGSFYGFWNGAEHYFTHVRDATRCPAGFSDGLDYRNDLAVVADKDGAYSPEV